MKAITTRFYGATDTRRSRVTASDCDGNSAWVDTEDHVNPYQEAARKLCLKMGWTGKLISGWINATDEVWVFLPLDVELACKGRTTADVLDMGGPPAANGFVGKGK